MMKRCVFLFMLMVFGVRIYAQTPIGSVGDLMSMAMDGSYYLTDDLVVDDWVPIGVFTGSLDGRGHVITLNGVTPDSQGRAGFFGITQGASISNVIMSGRFRDFTGYGGSLVAHAVNTTINNCETEATIITGSASALCGGLVGCMEGGSMTNSSSNATIESFKMGGLVGSVKNNASIRNSFANATLIFSVKSTGTEVGYLVHDNAGVMENNYASSQSRGWFIPSFEQLCMMMGVQAICRAGARPLAWSAGFIASCSMYKKDYIKGCLETGKLHVKDQSIFQSTTTIIKYAHEFYGTGYNIGDVIYIGGVGSFVFYVNEDGRGGLVTPLGDDSFSRLLTERNTNELDGFYNTETNIEGINYEHAQWHGGTVAHGGTSSVIPEAYKENPGKFFTHHLQQQDNNPQSLMNRIRIKESRLMPLPELKQLAYNNTGQMRYCYYPFDPSVFGLVGGTAASGCLRYKWVETPYYYGEFGPRLYKGNSLSDIALADTLNGWVKAHGAEDFTTWTVAGDFQFNENLPIHRFDFHNGTTEVNTAIKLTRTDKFKALRYASINHLSGEQVVANNALAYYGQCDAINANNISQSWEKSLFVTEEATLKGNYQLKANVMITLDNSDGSDFAGASYDWHGVSTPLADAPVGIDYLMYTNGGPFNNPSQVRFNLADGYFPTNSPYNGWDFYCYDEPNGGWPNFKRKTGDHYHNVTGAPINYTNESYLVPGKGYLWAVARKTGLQAYGRLNNGNVSRAVTRQGNIYPGYNMVGNPYHACLDFDGFATDNAGILSQSAYTLLDADKHGYITYCPGSSVNPLYASRYLHPHQGFFVQVNRNGNVVFKTSQTVVAEETSFRGEQPAFPLVNLIVSDAAGMKDYTTVELDRPVSGGALKMKGLRGGDGEVAFSLDTQEYSIAFTEGRPKTLPVHFNAYNVGIYTLWWDLRNGEFDYLHLIDNITGTEVDCLRQECYVFQASPHDYASRFKLVFSSAGVEESEDPTLFENDFAYLTNNTIVVNGQGRLELLDLQGRVLKSATDAERLSVEGLARGVYLLRLTQSGFTRVQKLLLH